MGAVPLRALMTWPVTGETGDANWYAGVVESAPTPLVVAHESGVVAMVNAAAERLFGAGREELVGQTIESLLSGVLPPQHAPSVEEPVHAQLVGYRWDGSEFAADVTRAPFRTNLGSFVTLAVLPR
jgi:PAS domain S-box-containing protein